MKRFAIIAALVVVLAVALGLVFRNLFPKTIPGVPRITTQYDTVRVLDTAWIVRVRHDTIKVNVTERVTVTVPETVAVVPSFSGMLAVSVGRNVGDSTLVAGLSVAPLGTSYTTRRWEAQFYTPGPLKSLAVDSGVPRINFYPWQKSCGSWCEIKHYLLGGSVGASVTALACTVTR